MGGHLAGFAKSLNIRSTIVVTLANFCREEDYAEYFNFLVEFFENCQILGIKVQLFKINIA
jgi:hypothetical protein